MASTNERRDTRAVSAQESRREGIRPTDQAAPTVGPWPEMTNKTPRKRLEEKMSKDIKHGGCWRWLGGFTMFGYGKFWMHGRTLMAHRVSWEMHNDTTFPVGLQALHSCDRKWCVNPEHIRPGTAK